MEKKERVNIFVALEVLKLLDQAKKLSPAGANRSKLIEFAVKNTFKNKTEQLKENMREAQREFMRCKDAYDAHLEEK